MTVREASRDIDAAAAAWVAREDRAPLTSEDQSALDAWLLADPRNPGALLRARAVALRSESARALGQHYDPAAFSGARTAVAPSRRRLLGWGGGAVATVAVGAFVGVSLHAPKVHATELGEVRLVPLADGSTIMLNTATRLSVKYEDRQRIVRLLEGEADFSVLPATDRPFRVEVGDRRLTASGGGSFRIRKLKDSPVDILVHQGHMQVASSRGGARPVALDTNTRLILPAAATPTEVQPLPQVVAPGDITRELAWRDGKIAFEGETLAQAAAAFGRYSSTQLVIADPVLAREPITGLFAANDPSGFGRAAAAMFAAPVAEQNGRVIIGAAPAR